MENKTTGKHEYEIKLSKVKLNAEIIPPISAMTYILVIQNNQDIDIHIKNMDIKINVANINTPFKADNITIKPSEKCWFEIERKLDIFETLSGIIRINDDYTIIGKAVVNDKITDIKITGEIE